MGNRDLIRVIMCLAVAALCFSVALGHYIPRLKLWELVSASEVILTGTVVDVTSEWNSTSDEIYTLIYIDADSVLKGTDVGSSIYVRQMGGTVDTVSEYVTGTTWWAVGERALMFLTPYSSIPPSDYVIVNNYQGKVTILVDQDAEEVLFWTHALEYSQTLPEDSLPPVYAGEKQTLASMIADIESLLAK